MKNTVEIKVDKVIKTFGSRIDFVRESSIYEKIKGKGLAPEVTGIFDGALEHDYIKGESFKDVIHRSMNNPLEFLEYAKLFIEWYKQFRDIVSITLGNMDFTDFIITADKKLYCIDFEHCKPGYVEDDIANFAANICFMGGSYSRFGMEDAKIFIKCAWEIVEMSSERLYNSLKSHLLKVSDEKGIQPMYSANEYLATFVCCAFAHAPRRRISLRKMVDALKMSNQMWTVFADEITGDSEKYIRYIMSASKEECNAIYLTEKKKASLFPVLFKTEEAIAIMSIAGESKVAYEDVLFSRLHSKGVPIENMK